MAQGASIGTAVTRREGRDKVTGRARYVGDRRLPGMLHGATVRAGVARARLLGIRFGEGVPWDEVVVVTARDIADWGGRNRVAGLMDDQPFLVEDQVNHPEEPVVLLAHRDPSVLERARRAVILDLEPLPAVHGLEASLALDPVIGGKNNCFKEIRILKGDPDGAFGGAATVVEGEYRTGAQEQLYLEPNGMLAMVGPGARVTVCGSLQCPYYVHKALRALFGLPPSAVRVVQVETGGAFGGKEDYPSILAGHAALLAWKARRPVRILYDREEDMAATTKRHPSRTRIRSAFDAEGRLLALDVSFLLDAGAYCTLSPVVLSRGAIHAGGAYRCPNVRIHARAMATSSPPSGAFRGFGAPQSLFAIERHMDDAARALRLSGAELRRRNLLRPGDTLATGQVMRDEVDLPALMDRALADLAEARARRPVSGGLPGTGLSVFMHGAGFTGSGEQHLASVAGVESSADGRVRVLAASTEIGQGKDTVFCQIVADALDLPVDLVTVARPDTRSVPDSGPTVASRSTMMVGRILQDAAMGLKQALVQQGGLEEPYAPEAFRRALAEAHARRGALRAYGQYRPAPHLAWDDVAYRGDAYPTFAWACHAADVTVDPVTCEVKVEDFATVQEVGRVINPVLAAGQIEGGVAQGIGWALLEEVRMPAGRMANNSMTNYIVATSMDLPRIGVRFLEVPCPTGPAGAKGLGELPMDGPAPALLAAVEDALGLPGLREVPLTPERLLEALETRIPAEAAHA